MPPTNAKPSRRQASVAIAAGRLQPHVRLVHGFLVRLPTIAASDGREARPALARLPGAAPRVRALLNTAREGPAEDTTFH